MAIIRDEADVVVVGGGVAGLWLTAELRHCGVDVLLAEADLLGGGQTRFAQGIIHGGLKFSLAGGTTAASRAITAMPDRWRASMRAAAAPDLSGVRSLSAAHYVIGTASLVSGITKMVATHLTAARAKRLVGRARPRVFDDLGVTGSIVELDEPVIDVQSAVAELARLCRPSIIWARAVLKTKSPPVVCLQLPDGRVAEVAAKIVVWTAGIGNEAVHADTQRRALHMVMVRRRRLPRLFAHCASGATPRPRLTVTSHAHDGFHIWYLGGELAETGVGQAREQLIARAREELSTLFPPIDLAGAQWATVRVDRAEARNAGRRPDDFALEVVDNQMIAWPTKLALAPKLAERVRDWVVSRLGANGLHDRTALAYPCPEVAPPPWSGDIEWS